MNTIRVRKKSKKLDYSEGQISGESEIGGSMPDPESDDNALDAAKRAGLYMDSESGKPKPVGIGREINKAERLRRSK